MTSALRILPERTLTQYLSRSEIPAPSSSFSFCLDAYIEPIHAIQEALLRFMNEKGSVFQFFHQKDLSVFNAGHSCQSFPEPHQIRLSHVKPEILYNDAPFYFCKLHTKLVKNPQAEDNSALASHLRTSLSKMKTSASA